MLEPRKDFLVNTITASSDPKNRLVLGIPKSTSSRVQSIKKDLEELIMATSQKSMQKDSPTLISLSADSHAKLFQSLENERDLKIPEGHSSLTLREYCEQSGLDYSSLKMLKGFSAMTTETLSEPSSPRLMSWGTMHNGKLLTAKIMESPKTANASSLSAILEEHPDTKYFLSDKQLKTILNPTRIKKGLSRVHLQQGNSPTGQETISLNSTSPFIQMIASTHQKELAQHLTQCKEDEGNLLLHLAEMGVLIVRRLTPLECERLQGFPDNWTR